MNMAMTTAVRRLLDGVIPGVRGCGCATIHTANGKVYNVADNRYAGGHVLVERYSDQGELLERVDPATVATRAVGVRWSVDSLGGAYT